MVGATSSGCHLSLKSSSYGFVDADFSDGARRRGVALLSGAAARPVRESSMLVDNGWSGRSFRKVRCAVQYEMWTNRRRRVAVDSSVYWRAVFIG